MSVSFFVSVCTLSSFIFLKHTVLNKKQKCFIKLVKKLVTYTCLTLCDTLPCLHFANINQATDTGWECWFPQTRQTKGSHLVLFYMQSAKRGSERWGMGGLVLKQEMTSIVSAQLATMKEGASPLGGGGGGVVEVIRGTDLDLYKKNRLFTYLISRIGIFWMVFMNTLQEYGRNKTVMPFWTQRDEIA